MYLYQSLVYFIALLVKAVRCYFQAEKALEQYRHFPSIHVIDKEFQSILVKLKDKETLTNNDVCISLESFQISQNFLLLLFE